MQEQLTPAASLPADGTAGTLVGRAWVPGAVPGPSPVAIRADGVFDLSRSAPTMAELLESADRVALARDHGERLGDVGHDPRQQRLRPARSRPCRISWRPATCRRSRRAA